MRFGLVLCLIGASLNPAFGSDGGIYREVPLPFESTNQRAELAPGELYSLYGRVVAGPAGVKLRVDLKKHPWLATNYRKSNPFYTIDAPFLDWICLDGRDVLMQFRAAFNRTSSDLISGIRLIPVRAKLGCE